MLRNKMSILLVLIRFFLGGVFVYSGFSKLIDPIENFSVVITSYQFVPSAWVWPIAFFLPWLELIFGTFLCLGFLVRFSATVLAVLSGTFSALLVRSILLKLPITECGCFGAGIVLAPKQALILDAGLFLMALCFIFFPLRHEA